MRRKDKIVVGWPDGGHVHGAFTKSLLAMCFYEAKNPSEFYEFLEPIRATGLYITENRNELVRQALELEADWLLQLDGDETFNPDLLRMLMRTAHPVSRPIVVGPYANIGLVENGGFNIVESIYAEGPDGQYRPLATPENQQPFQVDAAGTGVFLTHTSIFKHIPAPWFWLEQIQLADGRVKFMNEDIAFCRILRENGYKIWCEPLAEATHWKTLPLVGSNMATFLRKGQKFKEEQEAVTTTK